MGKEASITLDTAYMEGIKLDFNNCAVYVEDIIKETEIMQQTINDSYKGYASEGGNDFFRVMLQHLDVLKKCYENLAAYTEMTSTELLEIDRQIASKMVREVQMK